ncbi:MAG: hydantoinase/oxoprolinase family protein [Planctomycetes bacterium]|nr:hydantoinase/oxoprolinase family protein [Planctomycetota bacterium]MCP4770400.1 hydantoinase/oxoprolinase family protein [Planctomycetota bacterium]MCP4860508.1 hydantoinase/oxoprolinase family protein [Planctomycetota bacterium]
MQRLGIDTGGTFTDAIALQDDGELRLVKLATTREDASLAVLDAVQELAPAGGAVELVHGTTHATNALLTGELGRVVFVTTEGFADLLAVGRQDRDEVYALEASTSRPEQPASRVVEVAERFAANGEVVQALTAKETKRVVAAVKKLRPQAVAVATLFAFRNPKHEQQLGRALAKLGVPIMLSHEVAPEVREYERATTTWADAALAPVVRVALMSLGERLRDRHPGSQLRIMRSDGGTAEVVAAVEHPVQLALSGPAGGLGAALSLAQARGDQQLMTLDMGGTSTDVAWLSTSLPESRPLQVGRLGLLARGLPIHTVGTGGGSLAHLDAGGAIAVGPESAGAVPGPACYDRGGVAATVTDAHLLCGRLQAKAFLGGDFTLAPKAACTALEELAAPLGISAAAAAKQVLSIATADMERALRRVSLAEGRDPRQAVLYSFGGAGGLHAAWLATNLEMQAVVVPPIAGAFSAVGLLEAPARRSYAQSVLQNLPTAKMRASLFAPLQEQGIAALQAEGLSRRSIRIQRKVELRGAGQAGVLVLPEGPKLLQRFHEEHERRFGYRREDAAVELVAVNLTVDGPATSQWQAKCVHCHKAKAFARYRTWFGDADQSLDSDWYQRESMKPGATLQGPAVVAEYSATTLVPPGWSARIDRWNCLVLERCS